MYINKSSMLMITITALVMIAILTGSILIWRYYHSIPLGERLQEYLAESLDPYDPVPLAQQPDAIVWKDYNQQQLQWFRATTPVNYQQYGEHSEQWDDQVYRFLEVYQTWREDVSNREQLTQLKALGDELETLGCTDPYICYLHGLAIHESEGAQAAEDKISESLSQLCKSSDYPKIYSYFAACRLESIFRELDHSQQDLNYIGLDKLVFLGEAAGDPDFTNGHQRYYAQRLLEQWDYATAKTQRMKEFKYGLRRAGNVDPWIELYIDGLLHIYQGWEYRSGDWAYKVSQSQWKKFHQEIASARKCLLQAHTLHPEYPEAATAMISVSMAQGGSERQWFDQAVAAHFDYLPAYDKLYWGLRPRWGGSHAKMLAFGVECLNTQRFDTEVPREYFKALWDIASEYENWRDVFTAPNVKANIQTLCEGMQQEPTRQEVPGYWKSLHALFAWAGGDHHKAKQLFDEVGNQIYQPLFAEFRTTQETVLGEIELLASSQATPFNRAEESYHNHQSLDALGLYESLLQSIETDSPASSLLHDRLVTLQLKDDYLKGQWIDLIVPNDFAGWDQQEEWAWDANNTLVSTTPLYAKRPQLLCKTLFEGDYEIQGECEIDVSAALMLGYFNNLGCPAFFSINFYPDSNSISLRSAWSSDKVEVELEQLDPSNSFRVRKRAGEVSVFLNGECIVDRHAVERDWWDSNWGRIGIAGSYQKDGQTKFRNLRIRHLP